MTDVSDLALSSFVEALGSRAPAPGAGAAAGVALALAAGCAAKAFSISAHRRDDPLLEDAADRARRLARSALKGAQRDAEEFRALLHAPGDPGHSQALREEGEALMLLAGALKRMLDAHAPSVEAVMAGDLAAARALITAFERIQLGNLGALDGGPG